MNEWMSDWMNEWKHEWMIEWMSEWMNKLLNEWKKKWKSSRPTESVRRCCSSLWQLLAQRIPPRRRRNTVSPKSTATVFWPHSSSPYSRSLGSCSFHVSIQIRTKNWWRHSFAWQSAPCWETPCFISFLLVSAFTPMATGNDCYVSYKILYSLYHIFISFRFNNG